MIEPEIAFADLAADADLAESFLKYIFRALLDERGDDMKFFAERIDKDCIRRARSLRHVAVRAHHLHRGHRRPGEAAARRSSSRSHWGMDMQSEHERWLTRGARQGARSW